MGNRYLMGGVLHAPYEEDIAFFLVTATNSVTAVATAWKRATPAVLHDSCTGQLVVCGRMLVGGRRVAVQTGAILDHRIPYCTAESDTDCTCQSDVPDSPKVECAASQNCSNTTACLDFEIQVPDCGTPDPEALSTRTRLRFRTARSEPGTPPNRCEVRYPEPEPRARPRQSKNVDQTREAHVKTPLRDGIFFKQFSYLYALLTRL